MKTIELSLPTSVKDFRLSSKVTTFKSKIKLVTSVFVLLKHNLLKGLDTLLMKLRRLGKFESKSFGEVHSKKPNKLSLQSFKPSKRVGKYALYILLVVGVIAFGAKLIEGSSAEDTRLEVLGAKSEQEINKEFDFPLLASDGEEISDIRYEVLMAEKRDEIVVKGQRATAIKGRTFLIVSLKVTNNYDKPIEIDTRDYMRLTINGNEEERLAPDIHNDPVAVQAISTKFTRLGFPVNDTDTNLTLQVGEIGGDKQDIRLEI